MLILSLANSEQNIWQVLPSIPRNYTEMYKFRTDLIFFLTSDISYPLSLLCLNKTYSAIVLQSEYSSTLYCSRLLTVYLGQGIR